MQHNLPLHKQTTVRIKRNFSKCLFIYISKIVPQDPQANESNFEKIDLWWISHANRNTKISSVETSVVKELALVCSDKGYPHTDKVMKIM